MADRGTVGNIADSCQGEDACLDAASGTGTITSPGTRTVGNIQNLCRRDRSCKGMAVRGTVEDVTESCNEEEACSYVAIYYYVHGKCTSIGSDGTMENSCQGYRACHTAADRSDLGDVTDCC